MANSNKPSGLSPVKSLIAGDWDGRGNVYHIISTDSTYSYYVGDVVQLTGTGDANGIPGIEKFTPNDSAGSSGINGGGPVGVIVGIGTNPNGPWVNPNDLTVTRAPQTKTQDYYALVADDPFLIFEVQEGGSGTALAATAIGLNCNLSYTAAQSTGYVSGTILDNATEATTIGLDVRLLGLARITGNAFGYYARWLVTLNSHAYKMTTGI
jgi:hypothetical protein